MNDVVVRVENLGKRYRLAQRAKYYTLRDTLTNAFLLPFRLAGKRASSSPKEWLWALKEVSFTIKEGEIVGVIGYNGAGKSSLLKILSRVTQPTCGFAELKGRVGSLLEVGTGFHPELTGRDNIYLSGAILGMSKKEINAKFDEIVAFAEVEKFIDMPIKHYSSGMAVRLGFAVAAHLEPEILLVDEVLAVGDVAFQKKCLGKMGDVARQGRTILFVSHNMRSIAELCPTSLWIDHGEIAEYGPSTQVILSYLNSNQSLATDGIITEAMHSNPSGEVYFRRVRLINEDGHAATKFSFREIIKIQLEFEVCAPIEGLGMAVYIEDLKGTMINVMSNVEVSDVPLNLAPGYYAANVEVDAALMPGGYTLHMGAKRIPSFWDGGNSYSVRRAINFYVEEISKEGQGVIFHGGVVRPLSKWNVVKIAKEAPPLEKSSR